MEEKDPEEIVVDPSFLQESKSSCPSFQRFLYPNLKNELITDTQKILGQLGIENRNAKDLHLYQILSFQQTNSYNCGYHSLYSGQVLYEMISGNEDRMLKYFGELYSKKSFWRFFEKIGDALLLECKRRRSDENDGKEIFPWVSKNVKTGILERTYMEFMLKEMSRGEDAFFQIPDLCPSHLMEDPGLIPTEKIREISEKFESFVKSPKSCVVFLIGTLQHWFDIVANKYDDEKVEFIVICSSNLTYFGLTEEEMKHQVETKIDEYIKKNPNDASMRNYLIRRKQRTIEQTQKIVKMVVECCLGHTTFIQFYVDCGLRGILNEYYKHEKGKRVWGFLNEFPVKFLEDGIMEVLKSFSSNTTGGNNNYCVPNSIHYNEIRAWMKDIKGEIEVLEGEHKMTDERQKSNLVRLKKLLLEMENKAIFT